MMPTLMSLPAREVANGDEVELAGRMVTVTNTVRGNNGQRYLVTEGVDGGIVVLERDPGETVEVWRHE